MNLPSTDLSCTVSPVESPAVAATKERSGGPGGASFGEALHEPIEHAPAASLVGEQPSHSAAEAGRAMKRTELCRRATEANMTDPAMSPGASAAPKDDCTTKSEFADGRDKVPIEVVEEDRPEDAATCAIAPIQIDLPIVRSAATFDESDLAIAPGSVAAESPKVTISAVLDLPPRGELLTAAGNREAVRGRARRATSAPSGAETTENQPSAGRDRVQLAQLNREQQASDGDVRPSAAEPTTLHGELPTQTAALDQPALPPVHAAESAAITSDKTTSDSTALLAPLSLAGEPANQQRLVAETAITGASELVQRSNPPVDSARLLRRVARGFVSLGDGGGELRLRLSPPELGALRLEVKLHEGAIVARIETETMAARTALIENLPALRERLIEHGVRIERFDVDVMQRHPGGGFDRPTHQQAQAPSQPAITQPRIRRLPQVAEGVVARMTYPHDLDLRRLNVVI